MPGPQAGIYTASKFAVRGLTQSLRHNLAPYGIGVSLMCPGLTRTSALSEGRLRIERLRREGNRAAVTGKVINLGDLA